MIFILTKYKQIRIVFNKNIKLILENQKLIIKF